MTTRDRILLTLLLYQGKTSYQKIFSFLPPQYDRPNFYGILRRMEKDQLVKRSLSQHSRDIVDPEQGRRIIDSSVAEPFAKIPRLAALRLGPDALSFLESRFGPRIKNLLVTPNYSHSGGVLAMTGFLLVIYDFPLSMAYHRARLQTKLEQFGMGMLRKGVYISPYDISGLVSAWAEENKILDHIYLIRPDSAGQNKIFKRASDKIWGLSALAKQYLTLLDRLGIVRGQQIKEKRIFGLRRIKSDFLGLLDRDPFLPQSLIPSDWPFARVAKTLMDID